MTCPSCGASEVSDILECPHCSLTVPAALDGPTESTTTTPSSAIAVTPLTTASSIPDRQLQAGSLNIGRPTGINPSVPSIKVGTGLQVAAVILFLVAIYMASYSVTTYYYILGKTVTKYPLLIPGIIIAIVALVSAAIGKIIVRQAKAERLSRVLSQRD
jgi:hypothetical protein